MTNVVYVNYNLQNKQIFDDSQFYINIGLNGDLIVVIKNLELLGHLPLALLDLKIMLMFYLGATKNNNNLYLYNGLKVIK